MSTTITVELDSAAGPRVVVDGDPDVAEIEAALPAGWALSETPAVKTDTGGWSHPLVPRHYQVETYGPDGYADTAPLPLTAPLALRYERGQYLTWEQARAVASAARNTLPAGSWRLLAEGPWGWYECDPVTGRRLK